MIHKYVVVTYKHIYHCTTTIKLKYIKLKSTKSHKVKLLLYTFSIVSTFNSPYRNKISFLLIAIFMCTLLIRVPNNSNDQYFF